MQKIKTILLSPIALEDLKMKIATSCNKVKVCAKCKKNVYTFEKRKNRHNGTCEHLKCEVK